MRWMRLGLMGLLAAAPAGAQQQVYMRQAAPAWLGITYDTRWVQRDESCEAQVVVETVVHGSPAERAGLQSGDALLAINGESLPPADLQAIASRLAPGDSVRMRIRRNGAPREVVAVADRRPERPISIYMDRSGLRRSTAPVIQILGDTLVARNMEDRWEPGRTWSYWLSLADGRAEYRTIRGWSPTDLDRRVAGLLACADSARAGTGVWTEVPTATRVDLQRLQERADSLRVIIAQRAMERRDEPREYMWSRPSPGTLRVVPRDIEVMGEGSYTLRVEDHVAVGLRGVAGAELTVLEPELAEYFRNVEEGLLVLRIAPDTPADRAGLRPGDVVVAAAGRRLDSLAELRRIVAQPAGQVDLRIVRRGRVRDLTLRRQ